MIKPTVNGNRTRIFLTMSTEERLEMLDRRVKKLERGGRKYSFPEDRVQMIRAIVGKVFNVNPVGFDLEDRHQPLAFARHVAMFMVREFCQFSYHSVAREFGNRDHGTVINAVRNVRDCSGKDFEKVMLAKSEIEIHFRIPI